MKYSILQQLKSKLILVAAPLILISTSLLAAQENSQSTNNPPPEVQSTNNPPPEVPITTSQTVLPLSKFGFILSISVLIFSTIIICLQIFLIKTGKIKADDSVKFITITLIITSTLFLITAGYSNNQIAPAVGLLGTIAGYLLGRVNSNDPK